MAVGALDFADSTMSQHTQVLTFAHLTGGVHYGELLRDEIWYLAQPAVCGHKSCL